MAKEISDEELMALASSDKPEEYAATTNVEHWVAVAGIKKGNTRISVFHVYYTYRQWAGKDALKKVPFGRLFTKLFKQRQVDADHFYELDPAPFDLSPETYILMRLELRQERIKNGIFKPKEEKKKPS